MDDHAGPALRRLRPEPATAPLDAAELAAAYEPLPAPAGRPSVAVNFVTSVDGAVTVAGRTEALAGAADKAVFRLLRRSCDALLVGAGTLRNERYGPLILSAVARAWRADRGLAPHPLLVVVSGRLDLDPAQPALAGAPVRPLVLTHGRAPQSAGAALGTVADVEVHGDAEVDLRSGLAALARRGVAHVLCEGGPFLFGALTAADLVDDMCLTLSPLLAGPGAGRITAGPRGPVRDLTLRHVLGCGDELLLRYARPGPASTAAGVP